MKPLYIFDLDGTLCDISHRRHHVERPPYYDDNNQVNDTRTWKPDWKSFYAACVDDKPKWDVIKTARYLSLHADIWVWSGRSDEVSAETMRSLNNWAVPHVEVKMRAEGDYTPDDKLKKSWYDALNYFDRTRLVAVFDDRDRMVKMWRDLGVTCFQVAPRDF